MKNENGGSKKGNGIEYLVRARTPGKKELDAPYHHFNPDNKQNSAEYVLNISLALFNSQS